MSAVPAIPTDLLPTGTAAINGKANGVPAPTAPSSTFKLHDAPIENLRPLKVIVIGAGYSGIYHGIRIPEKLRNVELVIYEKNAGVGGTWWENRYLGCACDIPSHSYQYSFEPNPNWSSLYAPAKEIQAYLEGVAKKYSADRFIKLSHQVTSCRWEEGTAKWHVAVKNLTTGEEINDSCDVLVCARGFLNTPSWPDIEGFKSFKGEVMHSAQWNESYDFKSKRIGVIGSGSSSIQIVPGLQRIPSTHTTVFARSKTWISPPFSSHLWSKHGFAGTEIPDSVRERFNSDPDFYHKFRLSVEEDGNGIHAVTIKDTPLQKGAKQMFQDHMKDRLKDAPKIFEALLPSFSPGCRRLTPGPGYLEALTQDNVSFVTLPISSISESAVYTADGQTHELDALVCATGFQTGAPPPFPIIGAGGKSLSEKWEERATSYLSHSVSGFPNMFLMLGPNAGVGSGSLTMIIESIGSYIIKAIRKLQKENIATISIKPAREVDFIEYIDEYFKGTVFGEECRSWYKNKGDGAVTGLWPGSTLHAIEALRSPRWEDFEYRYVGEEAEEGGEREGDISKAKKSKKRVNRMAWLGNGFSQNEIEGRDLAWYLYPEFCEKPVVPRPEENEMFRVRTFSY